MTERVLVDMLDIISHDNLWLGDRVGNGLVWKDFAPIYVDFVLDDHIFTQNSDVL